MAPRNLYLYGPQNICGSHATDLSGFIPAFVFLFKNAFFETLKNNVLKKIIF